MVDSAKRTKKRKITSTEDEHLHSQSPRRVTKTPQVSQSTQILPDDSPWTNLDLILSLRDKDVDRDKQKVDRAYDYVQSRISNQASQSQNPETISHSRVLFFLNNWIQTLLISSEKQTRIERQKFQSGIISSVLDFRCWEILKFSLQESLKLNVSLSFSKDFLRVIQCVSKNALTRMSSEDIKLYTVALDCISSVFTSHGGVSNENLDLWILAVSSVIELVNKTVINRHNDTEASIFALRFSCVVLEPFTRFLRVHPTKKNGFHDLIDKLLEPVLHLLNVLHRHVDCKSDELARNLLRLLEEVLCQGIFHPVHIDGFLGLQSSCRYKVSEDENSKDSNTVIRSYHRHLFDKIGKVVAGKQSTALGGLGELYRLFVLCVRKQKMNSETRIALIDFFVQIMEPLLHEITTYLHSELEIGPALLDIHCLLKFTNNVLMSFMHQKVYIRTEDTSEGAFTNFLKVVYDTIISLSAKVNELLPSTFRLEEATQKGTLVQITNELIVGIRLLMEIEYIVVGDDLESLWLTIFSYAALGFSYMNMQDQSLLISEILHLGCQLINLYSELRQVNNSVFTLCKAVRRLVLSVKDRELTYINSASCKPSLYYESCTKVLRKILCSQELKLSIYNAVKSIPEGQTNGFIRNLTEDISESLQWMKADDENLNLQCFNLHAELLGRGLLELYTLVLDSLTVTAGNSVLVGISLKDLTAVIHPSMSLLVSAEPDSVRNFIISVTGKTFEDDSVCSHWFVLFFFRLYVSMRSLNRQIISLVPPQTSEKMSDLMFDSLTAYSGKDWTENAKQNNEGYFSWILEPSASLLEVAKAVSCACFKDDVTNGSALVYVLSAMAIQRLVDLNRLVRSFEYLVEVNDRLVSSKLTDDDVLSVDRKKIKKLKTGLSDLKEEAAGLTIFLMGYLPLVVDIDREVILRPGGAMCGNMSQSDEWDFSVGALDDKSLPCAIWWIFCQNIDVWSIHAAKKKLKMFLSLLIQNYIQGSLHDYKSGNLKTVSRYQISCELLSDAVLYEQRFVCRNMATSFCEILEKVVSPIFGNTMEVDLKLEANDWAEVIGGLGNSSVCISEAEPVYCSTAVFTNCQSLLNLLCWMPKEHLSSRSLSLLAACIFNFERLLVGNLLENSNALSSSYCLEHFRLFMSCRRALKYLTMASQENIVPISVPILWLLKSLCAVVSLQHSFSEDIETQFQDIIFSLLDHTSYVFLALCKYQFTPAIRSTIFDRSKDIDSWNGAILVAEALRESTQILLDGRLEDFIGIEKLKKNSSLVSCFQGYLWGLASALDNGTTKTFNLKAKLKKGKFKPLHKINSCIDTFADFVSRILRLLVLEDNCLQHTISDSDGIMSQVDFLFDEKNLKKSFLNGFLRGENLEAAFFLRQLFIASAAIIRLDLHMTFTSVSSSLVPILIAVSQALLTEFSDIVESPHTFSFVWLDGVIKFLEELGSHFSSTDSTNLYAKLIDLHLKAIGKCISLQGKRATLASHGTELSTEMLNTCRPKAVENLDEFKARLRMSFKIFVEKPSELHLLSAIEAIGRAVVGLREGNLVNYEICMGDPEGGKVSSIVAAGIDCLDLIMEFVKGRKGLSMVRRHIQSLVACLFNVILHLQGPQIFESSLMQNSNPDSGSVILMCIEVLIRVLGKHALFEMHACQIGQSLRIPSAVFQNFLQPRHSRCLESVGETEKNCVDGQFSVDLFAASCRLLCTAVKHHKRESQQCLALLQNSVCVLLHCLETIDEDSAAKGLEVYDGVKCAGFLRRIYEEIRQQKDVYGQHCFQFLSDYIWIYSGFGPLKKGFNREINEALKPGVYALVDSCSPDDLQHIHTVFGEGPCRSTLSTLQNDYKLNFQYEGKV